MENKSFKEQTAETIQQAFKGNPEKLYLLGDYYERGIILEKDLNKAYACYIIAKKKGYNDADTALTMGTIVTHIFPPKLQNSFAQELEQQAEAGDEEAKKILALL